MATHIIIIICLICAWVGVLGGFFVGAWWCKPDYDEGTYREIIRNLVKQMRLNGIEPQ